MTFFAHYDPDTGAILSIAGRAIPEDFPGCETVEIEDEVALKFLTHEWQLTEWIFGRKFGQDAVELTQDSKGVVPVNCGDIIEIPRIKANAAGLTVTLTLSEDTVEFAIPEHYKGTRFEHIEGETLSFMLTKRHDPSLIHASFDVNVDELFSKGYVVFNCDLQLSDYSMYTNRMFVYNYFEVNSSPKTVSRMAPSSRFNKLVSYPECEIEEGIAATYDQKANTLTLDIVGKPKLNWPATNRCPIFITKPKDPNIVYEVFPIDVESFWSSKQLTLQLPEELDQAFGVASYPLANSLAFIRKLNGKRKKRNN